ncbi:MAG: DUF11 domain-containing protein [Burkholderiaceae bacterium]|nr:DUF11 domain-containing protein [Burkholderiaceae bacterium]
MSKHTCSSVIYGAVSNLSFFKNARCLIVGLAVPLAAVFAVFLPTAAQADPAPSAPDLLWNPPTFNPINLSVNEPYTVTLTVANGEASTSSSVLKSADTGQITVTLPPNVTLVGALPTGCTAPTPPSSLSCNVIDLEPKGSLGPHASKTLTFNIVASAPIAADNLTAVISGVTSKAGPGGTPETNTSNNTLTVPLTATAYPDLKSTISGSGTLTVGSPQIYTVTVVNQGNGASTDGTVTITLPSGVTVDPSSTLPGYCSVDSTNTVVTCTPLPGLDPGGNALIPLTLTANTAITDKSIVVEITDVTNEQDKTNNTSTLELTAVLPPQPDLTSTIEGPNDLTVGESKLYTVTVANIGDADSIDGTLTVTLPAGMTVDTTATALPTYCTVSSAVISCTPLPGIAADGKLEISLTLTATNVFSDESIVVNITDVSGEEITDNNGSQLPNISALAPPSPTAGDLGPTVAVPTLNEMTLALLVVLLLAGGAAAVRARRKR